MDNPARTADYLARRDARLAELRRTLASLLAGRPRLTLEIGCGHGHYLTDYAAAHPAEFCLGADLLADRIARATRKQHRARLTNLAFLQAEALELLASLPAGTALQKIFVLFPDPWPKRRHHKNRLLQPNFLSGLARFTPPGAQLFFRTDDTGYFTAAAAAVRDHAEWNAEAAGQGAWPFERETVFQSRAPAYQSLTATRRETPPQL